MNVKYILLRNDMDTNVTPATSSAQVKKSLDENKKIKFLKSFGELDIYEYHTDKKISLFSTIGNKSPNVKYERLSSRHYILNIGSAFAPFLLVFKETYNPFWVAKIDGKEVKNHKMIYDYANSWEVEKQGTYDIEVFFKVWPWD